VRRSGLVRPAAAKELARGWKMKWLIAWLGCVVLAGCSGGTPTPDSVLTPQSIPPAVAGQLSGDA